jgi:sec-independent protein translocase protein TatC
MNALPEGGREQPLVEHLLELRNRLLKALGGFAVVLLSIIWFAKDIYAVVSAPLVRLMPEGVSMIATEVASPFLTPLKLTAVVAFVIALPWILYQIWAFVAPGLYRQERRLVVPLLASSTGLFYLGVALAYFVVLPTIFKFFINIAPDGVAVMTDINKYLDFVLGLFLAFGIAFETPVAIVLIVWAGFVTPATLVKHRDYVVVGVCVVAAVLTPPDVFSMVALAVPMYLLYELGIIAARIMVPGTREVEAQQRALS